MMCDHINFDATVKVNRLEDVGAFTADIAITCHECGKPFEFIGLPLGISCSSPTVSLDGLEMYVPIKPQGQQDNPEYPGFSVRQVKGKVI